MNKNIPAVSIVIPMYNAENYVAECLDSILAQTFDDYEVIAVDDGSTDKSCEIVESYLPKFGGGGVERLHLVRSEKNSGGAGTPRNTGLRLSRGKYIFLMDSDDAVMPTALEELYEVAEKFDADVVHCEKWFVAPDDTVTTDKNLLKVNSVKNVDHRFNVTFVDEPALGSENLSDKVREFCEGKFWWAPWSHIIKRNLLVEHDIKFSNLSIADDLIFSFFVMMSATKIVYVPNTIYVWRSLENSNSRPVSSVEKIIRKRAGDIFKGINLIDKFANKLNFFREHPDLKYSVFNFFTDQQAGNYVFLYAKIPAWQLDPLVRHELTNIEDKTALTAFLFAHMNNLNVQLMQAQNQLAQQPKSSLDFQRQNEIIARQQAQINELQQQLRNVHDVFR